MTVTARKRRERLVDVPVAVTELSSKAIERYNSTDLATVGEQLPGVSLERIGGGTAGAQLTIRGVGNLSSDYGNEQPVAVNVDGIPITRDHVTDIGLFDIQDLEVLKGPQALFFGKNSPAGVIDVHSANPGAQFEGYARVGYEFNSETPSVEGAVSIPLTDTLSVRFAGRYSNMLGGYDVNAAGPLPDPFPGETQFTLPGAGHREEPGTVTGIGRVTLAWKPTSSFDANLKIQHRQHLS